MARGRRDAHAQRRPERLEAAAVHDQAVRGDRAHLRPGLLDPPAGRPDAGRHGGPDGLPADGRGARPLPRDGPRADLREGGAGPLPAARPAVLRRRAVRPGRGARRPDRGHARIRQERPAGRRRGAPAHPGGRALAAAGRDLGRAGRVGRRHPRRARRQRRRTVGARGRSDGRHRAAGPRHGAHLPHHPGHARGRGARQGHRPRDADGARLRRRDLHPPGGRGDAARDLRAGLRAVVAARDTLGLRVAAAQARPRPDHAGARGRLQALPAHGHDRDPARGQRAVHVLTRWEPAGRTDPRAARLLGRLRGDGRPVAGRRRRARPGDLDDRRRPRRLRDGYLGDGRRPLRRLRDARLHERQGPGELPASVPDHVPERGAAGCAPVADDADLRPADRGQRGLGRVLRAGARAVVPGAGAAAGRGGHIPPLERMGAGRRRGRSRPRAGRHDGDLQLRQVPGHRPSCRGVAVIAVDGQDAGTRAGSR